MSVEEPYEQVLRDALENVFVVAVRRGLDLQRLAAEFDAHRVPGPHQEHILTISLRDTSLAVTAESIPHEWLSMGTGFIDTRFSRRIEDLLSELERHAQRGGHFI